MLNEFETAQLFAYSNYVITIIIFRLFSSAVAVLCMIALEMNRKKFIAHKSLKMLLNFHGFWTFMLALSTFIEAVLHGYAHLSMKTPSDLLMTPNHCLLRVTPQFFGVCGSVSSLLVMAAERYEASKNIATYESSTSKHGLKFVALHIILTLAGVFMHSCQYDFPTRVAHCSIVSIVGKPVQSLLTSFLFLSEFLTIYFFHKLLKQNEASHSLMESSNMSLSERYQLCENIRVLRLLLPIVISHTTITMAGAVAYFYWNLSGIQQEFYPIFEDTISMVYLQGVAMPLIFFSRFRFKRAMEKQQLSMNMSSGEDLAMAYDRKITKGW